MQKTQKYINQKSYLLWFCYNVKDYVIKLNTYLALKIIKNKFYNDPQSLFMLINC